MLVPYITIFFLINAAEIHTVWARLNPWERDRGFASKVILRLV
jgi:hypothetical protein